MKKLVLNNAQLGLFVMAGIFFLIITLYLIGSKQNMFSATFRVRADFTNISGLVTGNNVRFAGIVVGTVKDIEMNSDTTVRVEMDIKKDAWKFIKKTAIASIGTDGLMGNTIVNISAVSEPAPPAENNDLLRTVQPIGMSDMLQTLNRSNDNLLDITDDLKGITHKLNGSHALWELLGNEELSGDVKQSLKQVRAAASQIYAVTSDLHAVTSDVRNGKGPAGYLLTDTAFSQNLRHTMRTVQNLGDKADTLANTLNDLTRQIKSGKGPLGTILVDTAFANKLNQSMSHVEKGTAGFSENMEALKHNFLLRGYFRKKQKQKAVRLGTQTPISKK